MLFWHDARAAASRTFCTAGTRRPIRMAMIAITTNNSIRVKPDLRILAMTDPFSPKKSRTTTQACGFATCPDSPRPRPALQALFDPRPNQFPVPVGRRNPVAPGPDGQRNPRSPGSLGGEAEPGSPHNRAAGPVAAGPDLGKRRIQPSYPSGGMRFKPAPP